MDYRTSKFLQSDQSKTNFTIYPIGMILKEGGYRCITISSKFKKALLRLSLFSHAIILWRCSTKKDDKKSRTVDIRNPIPHSQIRMSVVKIFHINENKGYLVTDRISDVPATPDCIEVIDIKPYFPVEDRVKECSVPENLLKLGAWKPENEGTPSQIGRAHV